MNKVNIVFILDESEPQRNVLKEWKVHKVRRRGHSDSRKSEGGGQTHKLKVEEQINQGMEHTKRAIWPIYLKIRGIKKEWMNSSSMI